MPYIHFTEEQKLRANSVDLVEFLRRQGEKLISSGQDKHGELLQFLMKLKSNKVFSIRYPFYELSA